MNRAEWERVYDSEEFVQYTRRSPSVVSGKKPCVCAHITPNDDPPSGMGRKPDARWIVPMTWYEHQTLHNMGRATCEMAWGLDLVELAKAHWSRWQQATEEWEDLVA